MSDESTSEPAVQEPASRAKGLQLSFGRALAVSQMQATRTKKVQSIKFQDQSRTCMSSCCSLTVAHQLHSSGHTKLARDESDSEETTEPEDSPETARIDKAEKDWAERHKKKRKATVGHSSSDCEETGQPNPGFRSSSCTDFVSYMLGNVLSTAELQKLRSRQVHFAEFCAGMGTASQSLVARFA